MLIPSDPLQRLPTLSCRHRIYGVRHQVEQRVKQRVFAATSKGVVVNTLWDLNVRVKIPVNVRAVWPVRGFLEARVTPWEGPHRWEREFQSVWEEPYA